MRPERTKYARLQKLGGARSVREYCSDDAICVKSEVYFGLQAEGKVNLRLYRRWRTQHLCTFSQDRRSVSQYMGKQSNLHYLFDKVIYIFSCKLNSNVLLY